MVADLKLVDPPEDRPALVLVRGFWIKVTVSQIKRRDIFRLSDDEICIALDAADVEDGSWCIAYKRAGRK